MFTHEPRILDPVLAELPPHTVNCVRDPTNTERARSVLTVPSPFEIEARSTKNGELAGLSYRSEARLPRVGLTLLGKSAALRALSARAVRVRAGGLPPGKQGAGMEREIRMSRKYIDCREFPSEMNCSIAISADSEKELIEAAVQHAVAIHGHQDTPEFRKEIVGAIREGTPPMKAKATA